jgi:sugar/nucleoside kinase (ribokinase family)
MHLILGTTTVDLFVRSDERFPTWGGEHFQASNLAWCREPLRLVLGGNGANSACVLARLGAPVRLLSAVGDDALGALVVGWLEEAGVDLSHLVRDPACATATSVIATDAQQQRLIFHHPDAYTALAPAQVIPALVAGASEGATALLLTSWPLLEGLRDAYAEILTAARAAGLTIIADIGPAIGDLVRFAEIAPLLPAIDLLLANDHELAVLLEQEKGAPLEPLAQAAYMVEAGARGIILKQGEAGATFVRAGASGMEQSHVAAIAVPVAQTVGAGDAYGAGLLDALGRGLSTVEAMRWAAAVAALTVAAGSTLASPRPQQVEQLLASGRYDAALLAKG